jgi:hypothetical protein
MFNVSNNFSSICYHSRTTFRIVVIDLTLLNEPPKLDVSLYSAVEIAASPDNIVRSNNTGHEFVTERRCSSGRQRLHLAAIDRYRLLLRVRIGFHA